ncbi:MAG: glycosyltransferase family 2 protein [Rubrobacteraceae bacterium]
MESIRLAGVAAALLLAGYGLVKYRYYGGWRRFDLLLALFAASGVAAVSVVPQVGNIFAWMFGLENRAFGLLVVSNLVLFGFFLHVLNQVREAKSRSGKIVTGLAVREYDEKYKKTETGEGGTKTVMIIVPAYNEGGGIRGVLRRIPKTILGYKVKTVIVDDGSTDGTEAAALAEGFPVVRHVVNRGQGDALRTGFEIAMLEGADIAINLDADGQYKPEEMELLLKPIIDDEADYVHGSRFLGHYEEAGSVRHMGVVFFSRLMSLLTRTRITDCTNGFRAIRGSMLHKLDLREESFSANELILEGLRNKLRFKEVPVTMLKRAAGETKKPSKLRYPFGVFRVIIQTWLR